MLTFYITRHGNTEHNKKSLIMGHIDSPLTKKGLNDAKSTGKKLKNITFDQVYSSDLGRAFISAHIIIETNNVKKRIERVKELREVNFGKYANFSREIIEKENPGFRNKENFIFPEGESFLQMQKRAVNFIKKLEKKHPNKTILIVTHAGVIRAISSYFKKENFEDNLKKEIPHEYIVKFIINSGKLVSAELIK